MMPHQHCNNIVTVNIAEAWLRVATCHLCDDCEYIYVADNFQGKGRGQAHRRLVHWQAAWSWSTGLSLDLCMTELCTEQSGQSKTVRCWLDRQGDTCAGLSMRNI